MTQEAARMGPLQEINVHASSLLKWTCAFPHFGYTNYVFKLNLRHGGGGVGGLSIGKMRRASYTPSPSVLTASQPHNGRPGV
jgi:hypothetical protein